MLVILKTGIFYALIIVGLFLALMCSTATVHAGSGIQETHLVGIDLGTSFVKVAAFRSYTEFEEASFQFNGNSNNNIEIVLNDQTNRKSPPCIAFRYFPTAMESVVQDEGKTLVPEGYTLERMFAEQAQALQPRFPQNVICSPTLTLQNRSASNSDGEEFFVPFPEASKGPTKGVHFTAEELVSMLLHYSVHIAEKEDAERNRLFQEEMRALLRDVRIANKETTNETSPEQQNQKEEEESLMLRTTAQNTVRAVALAIPSRSDLRYRVSMLQSAAAAGLNVLQVSMSCTSAITQLALLRGAELFGPADGAQSIGRKEAGTKYVLLYDMGSGLTEASVWAFESRPATLGMRGPRHTVRLLSLEVLPTLGGDTFDECLARFWDRMYCGGKLYAPTANEGEEDVLKRRVLLRRKAQRAREVLSANKFATTDMTGLAGGSCKASSSASTSDTLSRETFEAECAAHFTAVVELRDLAIRRASERLADEAEEARQASAHDISGTRNDRFADTIVGLKAKLEKSKGKEEQEDPHHHHDEHEKENTQDPTVQLTIKNISRFEVIGGATRMPRLLQELSRDFISSASTNAMGRQNAVDSHITVGRTLNGEEAAVTGVTYLVASNMRLMAPLPFEVKEWITYSVGYYLESIPGAEANSTSNDPQHMKENDHEVNGKGQEKNAMTPMRILFEEKKVYLPAVKSIVLFEQTKDFRLVLFSSENVHDVKVGVNPEDGSVMLNSDTQKNNISFVYDIKGVNEAWQRIQKMKETEEKLDYKQQPIEPQNDTNSSQYQQNVTINVAAVVLEVEVGNDGVPAVAMAYLYAEIEKSFFAPMGSKGDAAPQLQSTVTQVPLNLKVVAATADKTRGNALKKEKEVISRLNEIDRERFIRGSLRNELESTLLSIKMLPDWEQKGTEAQRQLVKEMGEWLDDEADHAAAPLLEEKINMANEILSQLTIQK